MVDFTFHPPTPYYYSSYGSGPKCKIQQQNYWRLKQAKIKYGSYLGGTRI